MAENLELIDALDMEKLRDLYMKRRQYFEATKPAQHEIMQRQLSRAVASTELCMDTYLDYMDTLTRRRQAAAEEAQRDQIDYQRDTDELFAEFDSLVKRIKSEENIDEATKTLMQVQAAVLQHGIRTQQRRAELSSQSLEISTRFDTMTLAVTHKSLEMLFASDNIRVVLDAGIVLLKFLGSLLIPPLSIPILLDDLRKAFTERARQIKDASDLLHQLDAYVFATVKWSIITRLLIDLNQGEFPVQSTQSTATELKPTEDEMHALTEKVERRFGDILQANSNPNQKS
jgi:hypothetical protein